MSDNFDIKDYSIYLPPLGEGSYGRVFRATYRGISDRALKIFRPGAVDLSTMARELEKLSSVAEHHGIVTLHDFDLLNDPPYYAMGLHADQNPNGEWETRTLERLCGHVDHREAWRLLKDIGDAMAYLHRNQIIHCDVKPSNILLTDETPHRIKICDFGQSRGLITEGYQPVGTPLYASPEQLRDPKNSSDGKGFRWDVYSFGVTAYKLITGKLPRLQELADAERMSFDPEATVVEASLEATLAEAEGRDHIDGDYLATMTEAVEDIRWPEDITLSPERRELIERCLSLDPMERPADMREVWNTMRTIESNVMVNRARRLNALFGSLLIIAIWASGFAFVQAKRAREASEASRLKTEQAEELAFFIVNKLNHEEMSGPGITELYDHVADHSEAYLENLPKGRNSEKLLRISANTASLRGRQALEQNDLDEALLKFNNAYEIRAKLAESSDRTDDLKWLASRDLIVIGQLHRRKENLDDALKSFESAFELRSSLVDFEMPLGVVSLRELNECIRGIGSVLTEKEDLKGASEIYEKLVDWYDIALKTAPASSALGMSRDLLPIIDTLGGIYLKLGDLANASKYFNRQLTIAELLRSDSRMSRPDADRAFAKAIGALGEIQLLEDESQVALAYFRDQIKIMERLLRAKPNDPSLIANLANAYSNAALCFDPETDSSRHQAVAMLQEAVIHLASLVSEERQKPENESKLVEYNRRISQLLAMDE